MVFGKNENAEAQRSSERNFERGTNTETMTGRRHSDRAFSGQKSYDLPARPAVAAGRQMGSRTMCRFCRRGISYVDYKDIATLQKLLTNRGKIYSRKRSGNCAACQRKVKKAIKRARYMALLPFTR